MLNASWLELLREHGAPRYSVQATVGGEAVHLDGAPFMTLTSPMFDYEARIAAMDDAGVDLAIVSLTCPNAYWGTPEVSLHAAALVNDEMAGARSRWPDRIGFLCSRESCRLRTLPRPEASTTQRAEVAVPVNLTL